MCFTPYLNGLENTYQVFYLLILSLFENPWHYHLAVPRATQTGYERGGGGAIVPQGEKKGLACAR